MENSGGVETFHAHDQQEWEANKQEAQKQQGEDDELSDEIAKLRCEALTLSLEDPLLTPEQKDHVRNPCLQDPSTGIRYRWPNKFPAGSDIDLDEVREMMPPGAKVYERQNESCWSGTCLNGEKFVSRSWGKHGYKNSAMLVLRVLWTAYLKNTLLVKCPVPGIFEETTPGGLDESSSSAQTLGASTGSSASVALADRFVFQNKRLYLARAWDNFWESTLSCFIPGAMHLGCFSNMFVAAKAKRGS